MSKYMRDIYTARHCSDIGGGTVEVKEADRNLQAAHLLVIAAVTLIGEQTAIGKELLYVAETLSHPIMVLKQDDVQL